MITCRLLSPAFLSVGLLLSVCAASAEIIRLPGSAPPAKQDVNHEYEIQNAEGLPAAGFQVELFGVNFGVAMQPVPGLPGLPDSASSSHVNERFKSIYRAVLNSDGVLKLHRREIRLPGRRTPDGYPIMGNNTDVLQLRVTDPINLQTQIINLPRNEFGDTVETATVRLALAPATTKIPLFSGKILDSNGRPLSRAVVKVSALYLPDQAGGYGAPEKEIEIATGETGEFAFYATTKSFFHDLAAETPAMPPKSHAQIDIRTGPYNALGQSVGQFEVELSKPETIRLPAMSVVNFRVLDRTGKPVLYKSGQSVLFRSAPVGADYPTNQISARISAADESGLLQTELPMPARYAPLPGQDWSSSTYSFMEVTTQTITQPIDWSYKSSPRSAITGRVFDAVSGAPVAGVYVAICSSAGSGWMLARMNPEFREKVWTSGKPKGSGPFTSEEAALVVSCPSVDATAKTDDMGIYRLSHPQAKSIGGMIYWAPNTVPVSVNMLNIPDKLLNSEEVGMPDVYLVPSAEVRIKVTSVGMIPTPDLKGKQTTNQVSLGTDVDFDIPKTWATKTVLPKAEGDYQQDWQGRMFWTAEWADTWNRFETEWPVLVPANVANVKVKVNAPYSEVIDETSWEIPEKLAVGSTQTLSPKKAGLNRPFFVRVVDAEGKPVQGVSVNVPERPVLVTNADGKVLAWTKGVVEYIDVLGKAGTAPLARKFNVEIHESDEVPVVTLTLSAKP